MRSIKQFLVLLLFGVFFVSFAQAKNNPLNKSGENGGNKSTKGISAGCTQASTSTMLELNNVRALIHTGGDMWWDLQNSPSYEVPKGSGKHALFAGTIWIGGTDVNGQLRLAGLMHRGNGVDYWPGPLVVTGPERANITSDVCAEYDRHWVISREIVAEFRAWFNATPEERATEFVGYAVPKIIQEWPAHGDVLNGYDFYLAPFVDIDGDGIYNYNQGDYPFYDLDGTIDCGTSREFRKPRLFGDQTLWWVYNDKGNAHTETGGEAIGMEIRAQAFAFATNDELNNMTFGNYEIINRSTYTLKNAYFGVWTDADMGDHEDDYVGCDVARGLGYLYNSDNEDGDGNGKTYGINPPAVGIDFFEGPYQDPDGKDNLSSWATKYDLDCDWGYGLSDDNGNPDPNGTYQKVDISDLTEGNINGLNFGDGVIDNERWGMRRFLYFFNPGTGSPPGPLQDPVTAVQYYYYLTGYWRDGTRMRYGQNGYNGTGPECDFMFPWDPKGVENTDKCGWGTGGEVQTDPWAEPLVNAQAGDLRFVQSAGPFTLEPGDVNDITVGVVWARSNLGYRESVDEVRRADEKAQRLFENCFKVVDGPDAPELSYVALDKEIIFHLWNTSKSNNYMESYHQLDPFIVCLTDQPDCDLYYTFQGYKVYQMADKSSSISDLKDVTKARLVFQCDVKDNISRLINFNFSDELQANIPVEEVNGNNAGVLHTFRVTEDLFASGDKTLINNKTYYFIAIAYAHNEFAEFNPGNGDMLDGQKMPYLAGRKSAKGAITSVPVTPHITDPLSGGTILNSKYGDGVEITRLEGLGIGDNIVDLKQESIDEIMSGYPWKAKNPVYESGRGPLNIKIVDPLNVKEEDYIFRFNPHADSINDFTNGFIKEASWFIYPERDSDLFVFDYAGPNDPDADTVLSYPPSTIFSQNTILFNNEQLILGMGISIEIVQVDIPLQRPYLGNGSGEDYYNYYLDNNGLLEATVDFEDEANPWLFGVPDADGCDAQDWIRAGTSDDEDNIQCRDYMFSTLWADDFEVYENVLGGTWAPYFLGSTDRYAAKPRGYGTAYYTGRSSIDFKLYRLTGVDVVITKDKTKWTRCPVLEMCENDTTEDEDDHIFFAGPSEGARRKFSLRAAASINKDRQSATDTTSSSKNVNDPDYIYGRGMSWFPGYAIDVESGERLNMAFGEDSWLGNDNGRDMLWNPSGNFYSPLGDVLFGGKHLLYIFGHNKDTSFKDYMPAYDAGAYLTDMFKFEPEMDYPGSNLSSLDQRIGYAMRNAMWTCYPISFLDKFDTYDDIPGEVKVRLRIAAPYWKAIDDRRVQKEVDINVTKEAFDTLYSAPQKKELKYYYYNQPNGQDTIQMVQVTHLLNDSVSQNSNFPMFSFSTKGKAATINDAVTAKNSLDIIRVVPNPYYAHNSYEESQLDYKVKITNLPEKCVISIYSVNGMLIRKFTKDSDLTFQDWNLKNEFGILISSGVYIIHIDAPGIGETVVKWFGAIRPMDMNNF